MDNTPPPTRLRQLAAELAEPKPMRRGSLSERTIKCSKPGCACAHDPKARHGPYFSLTVPSVRIMTLSKPAVQTVQWRAANSHRVQGLLCGLIFYNYLLKCFVLFDLKTSELTHQDIGQMDMYVHIYDDQRRGLEDNPTVGIILCTQKDASVVRYSVLQGNEQLFASKYRLVVPSEEELRAELDREHRFLLGEAGQS